MKNAKKNREKQRAYARALVEAATFCPRCGRKGPVHGPPPSSIKNGSEWGCDYWRGGTP